MMSEKKSEDKRPVNEILNDFVRKQKEEMEREKKAKTEQKSPESDKEAVAKKVGNAVDLSPEEEWETTENILASMMIAGSYTIDELDDMVRIDEIIANVRKSYQELRAKSNGKITCHHVAKKMDDQGVVHCAICDEITKD
ncbi:MAG: hypothetical protein WC471_03255 [Candidatus Woesearchaeota archaeon]